MRYIIKYNDEVITMQYTDEQQAVINAVRDFNNIRVFALAGTGKTTTLKAITKEYPELKFLYLAFNRSICRKPKTNLQTIQK